jgi:pentatricopeptide repeat protein
MINAYGCARKDLNGAIGLFESIEKHPSTSRSKTTLPDAVVYEALFTVLSAHRRPDLIRAYLQRLRSSHVHPTAYVANAAIKGYAAAGDLESARAMFESLEDPPMGIAAPNNHTLHEPLRSPNEVPSQAPIYREVRVSSFLPCVISLTWTCSRQHGKRW